MRIKSVVNMSLVSLLMFNIVQSTWALEKQLILRVDGLACPFCAYGLEKKMLNIEGVLTYDADLEKGEVYVGLREDAEVSMESLTKAVKESGFTLRKVFVKTADGVKEIEISDDSKK